MKNQGNNTVKSVLIDRRQRAGFVPTEEVPEKAAQEITSYSFSLFLYNIQWAPEVINAVLNN